MAKRKKFRKIGEVWEDYRAKVLGDGRTGERLLGSKMDFYSGVRAMLVLIEHNAGSEAEIEAAMRSASIEVEEFVAEVASTVASAVASAVPVIEVEIVDCGVCPACLANKAEEERVRARKAETTH